MLKLSSSFKKYGVKPCLVIVFLACLTSIPSFANGDTSQAEPAENRPEANSTQPTGPRVAKLTGQTINVDGRPLHFVEVFKDRDQGPKPLVIFVHGTPGAWFNHASFLGNLTLQERFHMIALDRFGHGRSVGKIESSLEIQAASLKPLLDKDSTGQGAILVGHSLGGPIVARAAMDYQTQVSGLVFIASSGDPKRSLRWYNTVGGFLPIAWFVPKNLRRANQEILPLKKQLKAMLPLWKNIKVPTTIIQGDQDKLVNPKNADFLRKSLVNADVTMLIKQDADHFLHWRNPQIVVDVLNSYLEKDASQ